MCGRFTVTCDEPELIERFEVKETFRETRLVPRFNVSPTQSVAVVVKNKGTTTLDTYKWGLIPFWVKDLKKMKPMINARSESLAEKPFFKTALSRRRCLIPADGFYEWKQEPDSKRKTPMFIHLPDRKLFAFAGLWDEWKDPEGNPIRTCTIITTEANDSIKPVHDRMPVILSPEAESKWLDEKNNDPMDLISLLKSCSDRILRMHPVSDKVNSPKTDSRELIDKIDSE